MRGNLYGINTVATVTSGEGVEYTPETKEVGEVIEFRHIVETSRLEYACRLAVMIEEKRCVEAYDTVENIRAVAGELLMNGDEVVMDDLLKIKVGKDAPLHLMDDE